MQLESHANCPELLTTTTVEQFRYLDSRRTSCPAGYVSPENMRT